MKQFFILGASIAYGVGAEDAGWGDLIKQFVHSNIYSDGGAGQVAELYNFAKSGESIEFVQATFPDQLKSYGRQEEIVAIINVGGNNLKAVNKPDGYVSTPDDFRFKMLELLTLLKKSCSQVIVVGYPPFNEKVTNPECDASTGERSFFTNERRALFNKIMSELSTQLDLKFVLTDIDVETWVKQYSYKDGIHPNQAGHKVIFELIKPLIKL